MKLNLLEILRCPQTNQKLSLENLEVGRDPRSTNEIFEGWLVNEDGRFRYPIRNGIPRFVPESTYADNFGMQWNHFSKTQLDSHSGLPISAERFWKATNWLPAEMKNSWVLDVGCGSGRFSEVSLGTEAQVVALDYSSAVDAAYTNLGHHPNIHIVQADIYSLPFSPESFSFVYCLGVLQHTPNVDKAFASLPPIIKPGGSLVVDYYEKSFKSQLLPKYWLRIITKHMNKNKLFSLVRLMVPVLLPISCKLSRIPKIGNLLKRIVPVANYSGIYPLNKDQLLEWAVLDTFDWLSPAYDYPQTRKKAKSLLEKADLKNIEVLKAGHLVARGIKPSINNIKK